MELGGEEGLDIREREGLDIRNGRGQDIEVGRVSKLVGGGEGFRHWRGKGWTSGRRVRHKRREGFAH